MTKELISAQMLAMRDPDKLAENYAKLKEEQRAKDTELQALRVFYDGVQYAMDTAFDSYEVLQTIDRLTEDYGDAVSIRH
jgi:hypothetical protein